MPRQARIIIPHIAHHITQRGNYGQAIFEEEADYKQYLKWLKQYTQKYNLKISAYCLMTNHVHFIAIPEDTEALSRAFNTLHMRYSQYKNRQKEGKGHLWQGRFFSCVLDDEYLYRAIRYIENNPVRAGIAKKAWEYEWSSAKEHTGQTKTSILSLNKSFEMDAEEWKKYLGQADEEMEKEMRLKTKRGSAIGTEKFIKKLENKLTRSLKCLNPGRPKKP